MESSGFRHPHRITYADCTVGNHVYYARYLDLLEVARGEFFRGLGQPLLMLQSKGIIFPVTECHLQYHGPARYDDVVNTELWLTLAKAARLHFEYRMSNETGALLLEAETAHACTNLEDRPRRIPDELLVKFGPFVRKHAR